MGIEHIWHDPETRRSLRQHARNKAWAGPLLYWMERKALGDYMGASDEYARQAASDRAVAVAAKAQAVGRYRLEQRRAPR